MTLTEHLEDLRWCLLKSVLAIILASTIGYLFSDSVFSFIVAPLRQSLQPGQNLIGTSVFRRNQSRARRWRSLRVPGHLLSDLAFYRPRVIEERKEMGRPFCPVRHAVFCRRIVVLLSLRFAGRV